jgi:ATP-dependent protease HslVU (ClpYQ) peptidase subunit
MTCIVGLEYHGKVHIGGDLQGTGWNNKIKHDQPKVFVRNGIAFGYTTSYRFGQLLEHVLPDPIVPANPDEIYPWLIKVLVPSIKDTLKDAGYEGGGNCLIGVKSTLWELQNDYSILRSVNGYASVGSGYEYANGAMYAMLTKLKGQALTDEGAQDLVELAIEAAGTFSPSVGVDSVIVTV